MLQKNTINIAVSGDQGSFSELAAQQYIQEKTLKAAKIIYATDMEGALTKLDNNQVRYAVIPVFNKIVGEVDPAKQALSKRTVKTVEKIRLSISFCLMSKQGTSKKDITQIAYYDVAGKQCQKFIQQNFPRMPINLRADTGLAAKELSDGILSQTTAIIAPKHCSEIFQGLQIIAENIQDDPDNYSDFIIVTK